MLTIERTANALRRRFEESGWRPITVDMKANGDRITIEPCADAPVITDESQITYYLVWSPSVTWMGEDTLEKVADSLNRYGELLAEQARLEESVKRMKAKLEDPPAEMTLGEWEMLYQAYSDFSKEVYGRRDRSVRRPARMRADEATRMAAYESAFEATYARTR